MMTRQRTSRTGEYHHDLTVISTLRRTRTGAGPARMFCVALVVLACLLLSACAGRSVPAPVQQEPASRDRTPATSTPPAAEPGRPEVLEKEQTPGATPPRTQSATAAPSRGVAAQSLLLSAVRAATLGDWPRAQSNLERAVRLEPEDAVLWRQLAYTRFRQGDFDIAEQLAQRARDLSRNDADVAESDLLLKDIRRAAGEPEPAKP